SIQQKQWYFTQHETLSSHNHYHRRMIQKLFELLYIWFILSVGAAVENFLLSAVSKGLAACWTAGFMFAEEKIKKILEIPEDVRLVSIIALGYPARTPPRTPRKKLEEMVYLDKYSRIYPAP
ncbi:MAG: nitroreductase family protein, partial [Candidatus Freyarchaeota archaeon]|nr:nitroreductase family protein [Candidatus Jordarchaeia archaeon]